MDNQEEKVDLADENDYKISSTTDEVSSVINDNEVNTITELNKKRAVNLTINNDKGSQKNSSYSIFLSAVNYLNKPNNNANDELNKLDQQARNKWYEISTNVYDRFILEVNKNEDYFRQFVQDVFSENWNKITTSDNLVTEINNQKTFLEVEKKQLKISLRKFANVIIICFSALLIGLPFLWIYVKNRRIIHNFTIKNNNIDGNVKELNKQKIALLDKFYHQPTMSLLNYYLSSFGIRILHEFNKANIHNLIPNSTNEICTSGHIVPFKIGNHTFINYWYCVEEWDPLQTMASKTFAYTEIITDLNGEENSVVKHETVSATHIEPTPFRYWNNNVYTRFDDNATSYMWELFSNTNIQMNKKTSSFNDRNEYGDEIETEFNKRYTIRGIEQDDVQTLTMMNSFLTPSAKSTILKIGKCYGYREINATFKNGTFLANSFFNNSYLYTWKPLSIFLNYDEKTIDGTQTLIELDKLFLNFINELMYIPSILWSMDTAVTHMLNAYKYHSLTFGPGYTDKYTYADFETVISHALINMRINTYHSDAFEGQYIYHFNSFEKINDVDIYSCDLISYSTTNEIDYIRVTSEHCGRVAVPVPYVKYHRFVEQKLFFVYKNTSSLLGSHQISYYAGSEDIVNVLGNYVSSSYLICTPELKIIVINHPSINPSQYEALSDFIKQVDVDTEA